MFGRCVILVTLRYSTLTGPVNNVALPYVTLATSSVCQGVVTKVSIYWNGAMHVGELQQMVYEISR